MIFTQKPQAAFKNNKLLLWLCTTHIIMSVGKISKGDNYPEVTYIFTQIRVRL